MLMPTSWRAMRSARSSAPTPKASWSRSGWSALAAASICSRCGVERPTKRTRGLPVTGWTSRYSRSATGRGTERQTGRISSAVGAISGSKETTRSNDDASTCSSSHRRRSRSWWPPAASRGIGSVRKPRVSASRPRKAPAGTISGRKTTTTWGRNASRSRRRASASPWRRNSRKRVWTSGRSSPRAQTSKKVRCPTKASRNGRPAGGVGYGMGASTITRSMPDWQERITRETNPAVRVEHDLRYRLAEPLILGARTWADLGCGNGVAAADAIGGMYPGRAVLVDAEQKALDAAATELRAAETVKLAADLTDSESLRTVRETLLEGEGPRTVTCFEVIEHLETFVPLVELLSELAEGGEA